MKDPQSTWNEVFYLVYVCGLYVWDLSAALAEVVERKL